MDERTKALLKPQKRYLQAEYVRQGEDLWVYGYLITEAVDSYGTVLSLEGAREAIVSYEKYRNVREMHEPKAVGKAWIIELDDRGLRLGIKVVDPEAARKVEEQVYMGLSAGFNPSDGKWEMREGRDVFVFTRYEIVEATLCDRQSNPEAEIEYYHRSDYVLADKKEGWTFDWKNDADAIVEKLGWAGMERACAYKDKDKNEDKKGYKLPVMKLVDGELTLYWYGVHAAMAALNGSRGGADIPEDNRGEVYALLSKYYRQFDETPPELRKMEATTMNEKEIKQHVDNAVVAALKRLFAGKTDAPQATAPNTEDGKRVSLPKAAFEAAKALRAQFAEAKADEATLAAFDSVLGVVDEAAPETVPAESALEKRLAALEEKNTSLENQNKTLKDQVDAALAERKGRGTVDGSPIKAESPYGGAFVPYDAE